MAFAYGAVTHCGVSFQDTSASYLICNSYSATGVHFTNSHYPNTATSPDYYTALVWAIPFSLAATWGVAFCFPFLRVLRCFNSPGSLLMPYVFRHR
jgi:hypothetical protein